MMQLQDCPPIEYIRRRGQRNIRIRVKNDAIIVSAPWHCPEKTMVGFVQEREDWIRKTISRFQQSGKSLKSLIESKKSHLLLRGEWIPIEIRHQRPGENKWLLVERSGRVDAYPPESAQSKSSKTHTKLSDRNSTVQKSSTYQTSLFDEIFEKKPSSHPIETPKILTQVDSSSILTTANKTLTRNNSTSRTSNSIEISTETLIDNKSFTDLNGQHQVTEVPPEEKRKFLMEVARKELPIRFEELAAELPFKWSRLYIRSQKTKWGTCSSQGNISLNWRLIMCPPTILEYLVVHELSHTVQMNHSRKFWELVEKYYPDVDFAHKWLKKEGQICFLI